MNPPAQSDYPESEIQFEFAADPANYEVVSYVRVYLHYTYATPYYVSLRSGSVVPCNIAGYDIIDWSPVVLPGTRGRILVDLVPSWDGTHRGCIREPAHA